MKRKVLILLVFLLFLYMVPSFGTATEYASSSQSITSFSETLPDDVLFYPDAITLSTISTPLFDGESDLEPGPPLDYAAGYDTLVSACQGADNDHDGTILNDPNVSNSLGSLQVIIELTIANYYKAGSSITLNVTAYTIDGWLGSSNTFYSAAVTAAGSLTIDEVVGLSVVQSVAFDIYYGTAVTTDHINVTLDSMEFYTATLSENGYAEGFGAVSDWSAGSWASSTPEASLFTSDGDLASFEDNYVGTGSDNDAWYSDAPSFADLNYYFEIRYKSNVTTMNFIRIYFFTSDACAGTYVYGDLTRSTSWQTTRGYVGSLAGNGGAAIESVLIIIQTTTVCDFNFQLDYLRISPANETGWGHDCNSTLGTESYIAGKVTASSSDGVLKVTNTDNSAPQALAFWIDKTTTPSAIETSYYPFLKIQVTAIQAGGEWSMSLYDNSTLTSIQSATSSTGTFYYNIKAGYASDPNRILFYVGGVTSHNKWANVSFAKVYSIANFTYTGTGTSTDDVLYVDSGTLYCSATSITSIVLDQDPALSVDTDTILSSLWNVTKSAGAPQTDYYVDAAWAGYSSATSGALVAGTLTDIRIKFTDSANIAAIKFLSAVPQWNEINIITLLLEAPISVASLWALTGIYMLFGAGLIIFSGVYLVWGGRHKISLDKGLLAITAQFVGWALLIGLVLT